MSAIATDILALTSALGVNLLQVGAPLYGVVTSDTAQVVITPDTVLSVEYRGEQRISDYPVEGGGFSSFNKVAVPFDLRVRMACAGRNYVQSVEEVLDQALNSVLGTGFGQKMSRADFLAQLETMLRSLDLYDFVTPDYTYSSVNLVHYDYRKTATEGGVKVIADLYFREVRETVSALYSTGGLPNIFSDSPSAANPVNLGSITGTVPTTSQSSIILAGGFV